jgi:hypothetical protein
VTKSSLFKRTAWSASLSSSVAKVPVAFSMDTASSTSSGTSSTFMDDGDPYGLGVRTGKDRFRSLTDPKWGDFEIMGFGGLGADEKKLQFDLTEGARNVSNLCTRNSCLPFSIGFSIYLCVSANRLTLQNVPP